MGEGPAVTLWSLLRAVSGKAAVYPGKFVFGKDVMRLAVPRPSST